jgi:mannose-1-phosphate guanylyltransferase
MEKTINAHVVPASFGWSDVGNLRTFLELSQQTESSQGTLFQIKAQNNIAKTLSKPVFCIGVNDLCIIETEDALVVVHENNVEDVRQAVSLFKKNATPKEISF